MRAQPGRKHIVNTASLAGLVPIEGYSIYSCSKAAVVGLSEAIAGELAPHGIGITIVCPGQVPTGLSDNSNRIRASGERVFAPVATPVKDRLSTFAMPSVEPVGAMVCRAILSNQLYLHTMAVPGDLVADRLHTWFGPQTLSPAPA
jgi:short-subunit dehydrogenase